jgi:L-threonylcarbamoyladenylate synthase
VTAGVEAVVAALRRGGLAVVPTDTVYGLVCDPYRRGPARRLYALKRRAETQPTALLASSIDQLLDCVPELRGRAAAIARELLPGPFTLVLPNPAERFPWLTGERPGAIGVRVPDLDGPAKAVLDRFGALAATSANVAGGSDPARLDEVAAEVLAGVDAVVDGGELPGLPSTVLDFTGETPHILRQGAAPADEALARAAAAVRSSGSTM